MEQSLEIVRKIEDRKNESVALHVTWAKPTQIKAKFAKPSTNF